MPPKARWRRWAASGVDSGLIEAADPNPRRLLPRSPDLPSGAALLSLVATRSRAGYRHEDPTLHKTSGGSGPIREGPRASRRRAVRRSDVGQAVPRRPFLRRGTAARKVGSGSRVHPARSQSAGDARVKAVTAGVYPDQNGPKYAADSA